MKIEWKPLARRLALSAAAAASMMALSTPAQARHGDGGDDAAIAIGAGIIGLAVGAAIADRNDDRYYDRRYYSSRRYVTVRGRPDYYYYYDGAPNRYYRDRYYQRYYQPYYRDRWSRGRDWRADRRDWRHDRRDWRHDRREWRRDDRRDWRRDRREWRR